MIHQRFRIDRESLEVVKDRLHRSCAYAIHEGPDALLNRLDQRADVEEVWDLAGQLSNLALP